MKGIWRLKRLLGLPRASSRRLARIESDVDTTRHLVARLLVDRIRQGGVLQNIHDAEFGVYSQWGDDGIIQYLLANLDMPEEARSFVEFGVEDYTEATTRFLLMNDNWRGLVLDPSGANVRRIRRDSIHWKYALTATEALVTAENVDSLLSSHGFSGEIGLLHVDVDGNDYWIWKGLRAADPIIAVIEYNSVFGNRRAVTVPYDPLFQRTRAHSSNLYFGASLKALHRLAEEKGYSFVGCSSSANNAYFVRNDRVGDIRVLSPEEGYVESRFRESRDAQGRLTFVSGDERRRLIGDMPVLDIEEDRIVKLAEC